MRTITSLILLALVAVPEVHYLKSPMAIIITVFCWGTLNGYFSKARTARRCEELNLTSWDVRKGFYE